MQPFCDSQRDPFRQCARARFRAATVLTLLLALPGCGNVIYAYRAGGATAKIEEAKEAGAERSATYEYTLAQEYSKKASSEASEADYGDAIELSGLADEYAQLAIDKAKHRLSKKSSASPNAAGTDTAAGSAESNQHGSLSLSVGEKP